MQGKRRLLVVAGCLVCLLAVATLLPAADPRLDPPTAAGDDGGSAAGDWESVNDDRDWESDTATPEAATATPTESDDSGDTDSAGFDVYVEGDVVPGTEVTIGTDDLSAFDSAVAVEVDGQYAGEIGGTDQVTVTVPFEKRMHVSVPEKSYSRQVDVETDARIQTRGPAVSGRTLTVRVVVGSQPIPNATVARNGTTVGETDEDGRLNLTVPADAGRIELHAQRGVVEGGRTLTVVEPTIEVASPLLFPGAPAPVTVSADGVGVPNATVTAGNGNVTTAADGRASVPLPLTNDATITAIVGGTTTSTTVGGLYLRLAVPVIVVPGIVVGGVTTYLRFTAAAARRRHRRRLSVTFLTFGSLLGGLGSVLLELLRLPRGLASSREWELSVPRLSAGGFGAPSMPTFDLSGFRLGLASLGDGLSKLGSSSSGGGSTLGGLLGTSTESDAGAASEGESGPALAPEPLGPAGPRAEIRAAWHAFCDRLDVRDRETMTPGQVARRALAAGFPRTHVRRLVALFRQVEYGGRQPTSEQVTEAKVTAEELAAHDPDEEGSE